MLKPTKRLLERNAFALAVFLTLFVAFLSLVSLKGIVKININVSFSDKIGHFLAYSTLATSWFFVYRAQRNKWKFIVLALLIFGMVLEVLQGTLTTYRTEDWADELANATGITFGLIASYLCIKKQEN